MNKLKKKTKSLNYNYVNFLKHYDFKQNKLKNKLFLSKILTFNKKFKLITFNSFEYKILRYYKDNKIFFKNFIFSIKKTYNNPFLVYKKEFFFTQKLTKNLIYYFYYLISTIICKKFFFNSKSSQNIKGRILGMYRKKIYIYSFGKIFLLNFNKILKLKKKKNNKLKYKKLFYSYLFNFFFFKILTEKLNNKYIYKKIIISRKPFEKEFI